MRLKKPYRVSLTFVVQHKNSSQLEGLGNCIQAINASGQITVTAGTLEIVFDIITVEVVGTTLQVMILLMTNLLFSLLQNFSHILMDLTF